MGRRLIRRVLCLGAIGALAAACMALPARHAAIFQEPPLADRGTIPVKAGLMTLLDARPPAERKALPEIENLSERATLQILMDWSDAKLFAQLNHVNAPEGADVILKGEIRSFQWNPHYDWAPYIPAFGFLAAFGVPVAHSNDECEIALQLFAPKSDQPIASYTKLARSRQSYWVYRYQDFRAGDDREQNGA